MSLKHYPVSRQPCPYCGNVVVLTKRYDLKTTESMTREGRREIRRKKKEAK